MDELSSQSSEQKQQQLRLAMPTELERENLHNLDVGDDYHLQGDAKWETERKRVERERLQASAKIRSARPPDSPRQQSVASTSRSASPSEYASSVRRAWLLRLMRISLADFAP